MNQCAIDFIETVLGQIRYKKAHRVIQEELQSHIQELTEDYISEGMAEKEAMDRAVLQMGDPVKIGRQLHKTHKPKTEWSIVILLLGTMTFGMYVIFKYSILADQPYYFKRQMVFAIAGIALAAIFYFFDFTRLEKYSIPVYFVTCIILFASITFSTNYILGRKYITMLGTFFFTPSFAATPVLLISYAGLVKKWCDGNPRNLLKLVLSSILPMVIIAMEPSEVFSLILGAGFAIMVTFGVMSHNFKGNRKKTLSILYGGLFGLIALFLLYLAAVVPYTLRRLTVFLHPWDYAQGEGYTNVIIQKIQGSAKFIGTSSEMFSGNTRKLVLPCAETDFAFTFVIGKLGWLIAIALIGLLSAVIVRLFIASGKVRNEYGKLLCVGICCVFSFQVMVNILMNLNLFPLSGISLPFVSYGGQSCLFNMSLMGMLLGIYRHKDISFAREIDNKKLIR